MKRAGGPIKRAVPERTRERQRRKKLRPDARYVKEDFNLRLDPMGIWPKCTRTGYQRMRMDPTRFLAVYAATLTDAIPRCTVPLH